MKIRLGLLDSNEQYTSRLMAYFNRQYSGQLDIYLFTTVSSFEEFSRSHKIDVLIAEPEIVPAEFKAPRNVVFAFFSDSQDIESIRNIRAVCRYQKADLIFKEVVNLYSELNSDTTYRSGEGPGKIITFFGTAGGVGTTTAAVACAMTIAAGGKSVLFINLEQNGDLQYFLNGEGTSTLSDVLYAVKSKRANLGLKLNSMVKKDTSGVCFFDSFAVMLDSLELGVKEVKNVISAMVSTGEYEYLVLDLGSNYDEIRGEIMSEAATCFLVGDGTPVSNIKTARFVKAMELKDASSHDRLLSHTNILYNKFGAKSVEAVCDPFVKTFGKITTYEARFPNQVLEMIVSRALFMNIL